MRPHRTVPAAVLLAGLAVLTPFVAGCSSSSSGASPARSARTPGGLHDSLIAVPARTPKGRTTATYRAEGPGGTAPGAAEVQQTADRIRARLTAFGVTGATVEVHGTTVTATAPGDAAATLRQVAALADLAFRPVLAGTATPAAAQRTYRSLDCSAAGATPPPAPPDQPTAACDSKLHQKYLLGPAALTGADVKSAKAVLETANGAGWIVDLDFTPAGSAAFARVTGTLATQSPPADQFAILVDGDVLSAPLVQQAITGGKAQITGNFTADAARHLAALLTSGALPVHLTVEAITRQP